MKKFNLDEIDLDTITSALYTQREELKAWLKRDKSRIRRAEIRMELRFITRVLRKINRK